MKDFDLIFYKKPNGDCPVNDFLSSLNKVMRFKMMHQLDMLELYGNRPQGDYSKHVDDGIFELRAQTKTDITRILFFFDANKQIILTNGFVKKTQKMPMSELETAKRYRADYLSHKAELSAEQGSPSRQTTGPQWRPKLDKIVAEARDKETAPRSSAGKQKPKNRGR